MRRAQNSLEYIILIGGVVILSAASYFLMKGFLGTSGESTRATMERGGDVAREDLLNLGLNPLSLPRTQWYSVASNLKTSFFLRNTGGSPLSATVSLKKSVFSDNGVDTGQFEVGFLGITGGEYGVLDSSASNSTDFVFETPVIPAGESLEIILHYNNSSPYTPITFLDYSVSEPDMVVDDVESVEKTDFSPPLVVNMSVETPEASAGDTIGVFFFLQEESQLSSLTLGLSGELVPAGVFEMPVLGSDDDEFGVWSVFDVGSAGGSLIVMPSYDGAGGGVSVSIIVPESGNVTLTLGVVDVWGNLGSGNFTIIVSSNGTSGVSENVTPPLMCPDSPPIVLLQAYLEDEMVDMDGSQTAFWNYSGSVWTNPSNLTTQYSIFQGTTGYDSSCRKLGHWIYRTSFDDFQVAVYDGENWSAAVNVAENKELYGFVSSPTNFDVTDVDLSKNGSTALAVWSHPYGYSEVWASEWDGATWAAEVDVSNNGSSRDVHPSVAFSEDGNTALAVWIREDVGLMSAKWSSSGGWSSPVLAEAGNISSTELVFDGNRAIAVFEKNHNLSSTGLFPDDFNHTEAFAKEWTESGGWDGGTLANLSSTPDIASFFPRVGLDSNGRSVAVWFDEEAVHGSPPDIIIRMVYSYRQSAGDWTSPQVILQRTYPFWSWGPPENGADFWTLTAWLFAQSQLVYNGDGDLMFVWYEIEPVGQTTFRIMEIRWDGSTWSAPTVVVDGLPIGQVMPPM